MSIGIVDKPEFLLLPLRYQRPSDSVPSHILESARLVEGDTENRSDMTISMNILLA